MRFVLMLVLVVGCGTKPNPKSCLDNHCSDPDFPFCDVDGSIGGDPNKCIEVDCKPNAFEECRGDRALTCNATGDNYDLVECEFGCGASGCNECTTSQCAEKIAPRYVPTACNDLATQPLVYSQNTMLDTSDDAACSAIILQPDGPDICLLKYSNITVDTNKTLSVTGNRALALVADHDVDVNGIIDVSANRITSGPAGGTRLSGTASTSLAGGGGAGYRSPGGAGGNETGSGGASNGGMTVPSPIASSILLGGTKAAQAVGGNSPGGAGGAITLVACRGTLSMRGVIDAGGGGGNQGANIVGQGYTPPTGGGSGGTIALQGLQVKVTGHMYANGGGGGGGGGIVVAGASSAPGQDGQRSTSQALGGTGDSNSGRAGGVGGAELGPTDGTGGGASIRGGAGGGSAGYIVVFAPPTSSPVLMPVEVSPAIEPVQTLGN